MKRLSLKIAVILLAMTSVSSCKKHTDKPVQGAVKFDHCRDTQAKGTIRNGKTTAAYNFVAIGPNPGSGTPYFHGVSGAGFPLTPIPTPGGDNIIRNGKSRRPLNNVDRHCYRYQHKPLLCAQ